ncbi:MAG: hypothetical protein ACOX19_00905 [Fermentimonas sp.]
MRENGAQKVRVKERGGFQQLLFITFEEPVAGKCPDGANYFLPLLGENITDAG